MLGSGKDDGEYVSIDGRKTYFDLFGQGATKAPQVSVLAYFLNHIHKECSNYMRSLQTSLPQGGCYGNFKAINGAVALTVASCFRLMAKTFCAS